MLTSCNAIKDPEFKDVSNVKILNASMEKIDIEADILMHNPNGFEMNASSAEIVAFFDQKEVAQINQKIDGIMPANGDFTFPINVTVNPKDLFGDDVMAAMAAAMQLLSKRELNVMFNGNINVGKGVFNIDVPIEYNQDVKF